MSIVVRAAKSGDLEQLTGLLDKVDPGMITMPQSAEAMEERIHLSEAAFSRTEIEPENEAYFLVLEEDKKIIGTASIFTMLGASRPFYNYRISRQSKFSPETNVSVELDVLHLVNDHHGDSELGTLFILPGYRGGGRGRLLSFSRLMLIASEPLRFGPRIMAEIRGWTDTDGYSPFWEAVGRKFFKMDYQVADRMSAKDHRFISDLMPRYPVYMELLPDSAQEVVAKPHPHAEPAKSLLESQGFRFNNMVDIFDAGPCVECFTDSVDIVRRTERLSAKEWSLGTSEAGGLIAKADFKDFIVTSFRKDDPRNQVLERLGVTDSDEVLAYTYGEARKWRTLT